MKKAQTQQIFIYITAIIVFSLILIYGFNAIKTLSAKTEDVVFIQIEKDMKSSVKSILYDYGSIEKKEISATTQFTKFCIVDTTITPNPSSTAVCNPSSDEYNLLVCDGWQDKSENMFLIGPSKTKSFMIDDIKVTDPPAFLCIPILGGKATIKLEGKGNHVLVSEWGLTDIQKMICEEAENSADRELSCTSGLDIIGKVTKDECCMFEQLCCI